MPYLLLSFAFYILVIPLIFRTETGVSGSNDEIQFHYRTILAFAEGFPNLDLRNYHSATTPLYHIMMMLAGFIVGTGLVQLRFISAVISLICLLVVYGYLSKRGDVLKGLLFSLIFLLSPYFIRSAIMLFTDNMALLFAFLAIMMIDVSVLDKRRFLLANVFILFTLLIRQSYAWLVGASLLTSLRFREGKGPRVNLYHILPTLIPVLGLAFFVLLWGGLTPPSFQRAHEATTLNWDVPVYVISLVGLYGTLFAPWYLGLYRLNHNRWKAVYIVGLVALAVQYLLLHPVSDEYYNPERGGALWLMTTYVPMLFSSSFLYWILFPTGLVWLYIITQHLVSTRDHLMAICFPLWLIANMANERTYQRYYEPFLLFTMGYVLVILDVKRWYYWIGPVALLLGLTSMTGYQYVLRILFFLEIPLKVRAI